jgi:hypothetical protein
MSGATELRDTLADLIAQFGLAAASLALALRIWYIKGVGAAPTFGPVEPVDVRPS